MSTPNPIPEEKRLKAEDQLMKLIRRYLRGEVAQIVIPPPTREGNVFPVISDSATTEKVS